MTISVTENTDGTFTIDWDQEDPKESLFNDWTEEDFTNAISAYLEELIAKSDDPDNEEFSIEEALEDILDQQQENSSQVVRKDEEDERTPRLFF
jgi:hypothetical protein